MWSTSTAGCTGSWPSRPGGPPGTSATTYPTNRLSTYGDVNAPGSKVAALSAHPRAMRLLDALGVKPSISYLTTVRNDKA